MKKRSIKIFTLILCTLIIITQVSCSSNKPFSKTGFYLNTDCQISILGKSEGEAEKIVDEAFELVSKYEKMLSRTVKGSDIYKINHANGNPVEVSDEALGLIKDGIEVSRMTGGKFDITVGRLAQLWNFSASEPKLPRAEDISEAAATVGYENIHIDGKKVWLSNGCWLDLGASAKGYIADKVSEYIESQGVESAIVNLGGNIVTLGQNIEKDRPWNIGIEAPYSDRRDMVGSIEMENQTVVTSGTYERFFEEGGKKYHHILNTETGYPVDSDIVSISILSNKGNSEKCDIYSTSSLLLGSKGAEEFLKSKKGFEYLIIKTDGSMIKSEGFNLIEGK